MRFYSLSLFLVSALLALSEEEEDKRRGYPCCQESSSSSSCIIPPPPEPPVECCETIVIGEFDFNRTLPTVDIVTDDGTFVSGACGSALISNPFTQYGLSFDRQEDHFKYLALSHVPVKLLENSNLTFSWIASGKTFRINQSPFPESYLDDDDYRLANAQLVTYDALNHAFFNILLTNDRVYALYAILPGGLQKDIGRAAFSVVVPMKVRRPCDTHKLKIVFYTPLAQVAFFVDGHEGFRILRPGFMGDRRFVVNDLGGVETDFWPLHIHYGYGTATFLDYYPTCQRIPGCDFCSYPQIREALVNTGQTVAIPQYNPILGPDYPARYLYEDGTPEYLHVWGQGALLNLTRLVIYQDVCW